ncbi:MAG: chemotaxis protein CheX [Candidatus Anammoxibacter sp.]
MDEDEMASGITKAIKEATTEIFSTMLMLDIKAEESFVKDEKNVNTDIISSLHFFGEKYMGKIALFSSGAVACHIANAMLDTEETIVNDEIKDSIGEIVNMVAGGAKTRLLDTLGDIHLLTPWVIAGHHLTIASPSDGDGGLSIDSQAQFSWIMTQFNFANGNFLVGVQMTDVPQKKKDDSGANIDVKALTEENHKLKKEIEQLKAQLKG